MPKNIQHYHSLYLRAYIAKIAPGAADEVRTPLRDLDTKELFAVARGMFHAESNTELAGTRLNETGSRVAEPDNEQNLTEALNDAFPQQESAGESNQS